MQEKIFVLLNQNKEGRVYSLVLRIRLKLHRASITILTMQNDALIWSHSHDGSYKVWSAYHIIMEIILDTNNLKTDGDWLTIWKLKIPPKIKLENSKKLLAPAAEVGTKTHYLQLVRNAHEGISRDLGTWRITYNCTTRDYMHAWQ